MVDLLVLSFSTIFISNFVLARFLGICPFLGVSRKLETSLGMGFAVTFVMTMASVITYGVQKLLVLYNVEFLRTISFILVIAVLVQFVEMIIKKRSEEHTSELQSRPHLVCRLLLEKKKDRTAAA